MKSMYGGEERPDDECLFVDGVLYILCREGEGYSIGVECVDCQYGEPVSLADIAQRYPNVFLLIHDSWLNGEVFRYDNYGEKEWTQTGQTRGFA